MALTWAKRQITVKQTSGDKKVPAQVTGSWGVHKTVGRGRWTITHILSGLALNRDIQTQKLARAIVEGMVDAVPDLHNARTPGDIERHKAVIFKVLRNPPPVSKQQRAPMKQDHDARITAILQGEGLQPQGGRYGKAGEFWGVKGNARMIAVGRREILLNYFIVVTDGEYPKRPDTRWNNYQAEYKSKITDNTLVGWAKWVKKGYTTAELRKMGREKAIAALAEGKRSATVTGLMKK